MNYSPYRKFRYFSHYDSMNFHDFQQFPRIFHFSGRVRGYFIFSRRIRRYFIHSRRIRGDFTCFPRIKHSFNFFHIQSLIMINKNDFDSEISKMIKYQNVFKVHFTLYFKVHFTLFFKVHSTLYFKVHSTLIHFFYKMR